jgi:flagellar basal-body rod modification protein FlgD
MDVSANTFSSTQAPRTNSTREDEQQRKSEETDKKLLDYNAFLHLLMAQIKYQDPTDPRDPTEQIAQLASFSAVEQGVKTNAKLDSLLTAYSLSQADAVIGRTITSADGETSGKVKSVRIVDGGAVAVLENGKEVTLGSGVVIS